MFSELRTNLGYTELMSSCFDRENVRPDEMSLPNEKGQPTPQSTDENVCVLFKMDVLPVSSID